MTSKRSFVIAALLASCVFSTGETLWAGQYGPGASDTEIKIGNTMAYSGPASAYGILGKTESSMAAL
jgi:hypothetical protein